MYREILEICMKITEMFSIFGVGHFQFYCPKAFKFSAILDFWRSLAPRRFANPCISCHAGTPASNKISNTMKIK